MANHQHRAIEKLSKTHGFTRCLCASEGGHITVHCEPRAHGGVMHVDVCRCGAERRVNTNGQFRESGGWIANTRYHWQGSDLIRSTWDGEAKAWRESVAGNCYDCSKGEAELSALAMQI